MVSTTRERLAAAPPARPGPAPRPDRVTVAVVLVSAAVAVAAWLPFLHDPLTPDEGGFLLLGQHWSAGTSLYGDYWVDRPPLLIALFSLAGHLGGSAPSAVGLLAPAVKLMGALSAGAAVLLAGALGRQVAPGSAWSVRAAALTAAALLSSPLLGMPETDGEVLAAPLVLLGLACLVGGLRRPWGRRAAALAVAAGVAGTGAALVKQNMVDLFVFSAVAFPLARGHVVAPGRRALWFAAGAAAALGTALAGAATRGTSPSGLWDAIVTFRLDAFHVIGTSATDSTGERMRTLALDFLTSGAATLLLAAVVVAAAGLARARRTGRRDALTGDGVPPAWLVWSTLAMVAWELCGVALGGSYWRHYLTGMVPGLVLLVALAPYRRRPRRILAAALACTVVATLAAWIPRVLEAPSVSSEAQVQSYLRRHAAPSDGVVVAFGNPQIVAGSGLASPYPELWSLPVRVRDPRLQQLFRVMSGPHSPRWMVVAGDSIYSWGLDDRAAQHAQRFLQQHYVQRATYGDWHVWQQRPDATR